MKNKLGYHCPVCNRTSVPKKIECVWYDKNKIYWCCKCLLNYEKEKERLFTLGVGDYEMSKIDAWDLVNRCATLGIMRICKSEGCNGCMLVTCSECRRYHRYIHSIAPDPIQASEFLTKLIQYHKEKRESEENNKGLFTWEDYDINS